MKAHNWKRLFWALVSINLLVVVAILILVYMPADNKYISSSPDKENDIEFKVQTNKKDLNRLINKYLAEEGMTGPIHYEVFLTDDVELYGTIPAFGKDMDLKLTFEPRALKNGDMVLKQKSISLGQMKIPVSFVMKVINEQYKMPDWVNINPNDEQVYISLQNMKLKSDIRVKAEKFDLQHDDIRFLLYVPTGTNQ
ncbi:YpmS family protein [Peribacillus sp. SCS-155]|uniref:YpmS family protein n=1 Tax=Peribacillus sedimenti TaxID=3115297 RepID=UPI0039068E24